jgi:hypothetical protein
VTVIGFKVQSDFFPVQSDFFPVQSDFLPVQGGCCPAAPVSVVSRIPDLRPIGITKMDRTETFRAR